MCAKISDFIHSANFYDLVNKDYLDDLNFYLNYCKSTSGRVLELCCGTGRLTIPLAQQGIKIDGLDKSESMLKRLKQKMIKNDIDINLYKEDILDFKLNIKYSLIILPFNSLQCIYSLDDVEKVLINIKNTLKSDGTFIFDVYNPSIDLMVKRAHEKIEVARFKDDENRDVVIQEECKYDSALQINMAKWHVCWNNVESVYNIDTRCFYPIELECILKHNGYKVEKKYGDFLGGKFTKESMKQIFVCSINN